MRTHYKNASTRFGDLSSPLLPLPLSFLSLPSETHRPRLSLLPGHQETVKAKPKEEKPNGNAR